MEGLRVGFNVGIIPGNAVLGSFDSSNVRLAVVTTDQFQLLPT